MESCYVTEGSILEISQELFIKQSINRFLYEVSIEVKASLGKERCGFVDKFIPS
jgi:hypothetical protein